MHDPDRENMYYSDCRLYGGEKVKGASFMIGTNNFKLKTIKNHEMSVRHTFSIIIKWAKTASLQRTVAVKSLLVMKSAKLKKMRILFRNAHAVGKKGQHFTDYMWMCE